jgi:hypothetical protein
METSPQHAISVFSGFSQREKTAGFAGSEQRSESAGLGFRN